MRQILYVSTSNPANISADLAAILEQSRHNNALDGVTGLLWSDGLRFIQVFEGPNDSVEATFERIRADKRHHAINVLVDKPIAAREFGDWTMAHRQAGPDAAAYTQRVARLLHRASDEVRDAFADLLHDASAH